MSMSEVYHRSGMWYEVDRRADWDPRIDMAASLTHPVLVRGSQRPFARTEIAGLQLLPSRRRKQAARATKASGSACQSCGTLTVCPCPQVA